ncbi:NUDIX domain-containing protein, partial [Vibrio cholerae O1]|nr:NUDIX domain-containing protein [Vibrio cholerae O1]
MDVVIKNNLILIKKRFRKNTGIIFEFPGGSIDAGESREQASSRELWEE